MTIPPVRAGGCLCGAVRYRIVAAPRSVGYCHCRMCQRSTGAPVTAWATFPAAAFTFLQGAARKFASSTAARRGFCRACGTPLTFRFKRGSTEWVDVTVACLDEPASLPPQYHIRTDSRVPWLDVADALPRHAQSGPDLAPED